MIYDIQNLNYNNSNIILSAYTQHNMITTPSISWYNVCALVNGGGNRKRIDI